VTRASLLLRRSPDHPCTHTNCPPPEHIDLILVEHETELEWNHLSESWYSELSTGYPLVLLSLPVIGFESLA
jgi:hypothetical protein